jgi:tetratricopeptide (TPR) repeat protein
MLPDSHFHTFSSYLEETIELVEKALRLNPRFVWHLYALGRTYSLVGRREEAIAVEKRVLTRAPNLAPA